MRGALPGSDLTRHAGPHPPLPTQWYFAPPGLTSTRGTTLRSLKHALGPQFGSCCLGSLVLTVAEIMRSALEK